MILVGMIFSERESLEPRNFFCRACVTVVLKSSFPIRVAMLAQATFGRKIYQQTEYRIVRESVQNSSHARSEYYASTKTVEKSLSSGLLFLVIRI